MDIGARIAAANTRLKSANVGVRLTKTGDRLYLRGTFPPKPGSGKLHPHQQWITLGIYANAAGVKRAEAEAKAIGGLLACKEFSWVPYLEPVREKSRTASTLIEEFKAHYLAAGGTETTWQGDYWKPLKNLPQDQQLTSELLQALILATVPNTKTRKRACMAAGAIAKFAGLDFNPASLSGNYSPRRVSPRDLPDDLLIAEVFYRLKNQAWRWVYGMLATYGLRPHEVFRLDLQELSQGSQVITVLEKTKTGTRRVWPCYPEWFDQFHLSKVNLPPIDLSRSNDKVGHSATRYFADHKLPFKLYDLRHCWAIRTMEFGLDISLAAQQMGHSVQVHTETYHHWISDRHHQRAFETLMMRSDRPTPPSPLNL
ncbi:integrase [Leptolyngbya sp. 'hensonii']|uniref:site-specific integrase n=1 Tax=Leptolyngbya sp. 'hensonii' TaxID=1922337 RepID=UPI0009503572|nr:site-specific integrase [Leptolyngbya sp. 'hensonii']OLP18103.1 integrase [Leptolyngbya sp. 'hensonii']